MDNLLEPIKDFAEKAHGDQRRKFADEPYIAHPIRVMETCAKYTHDTAVLAAALLHDVLEDTPVTKQQLDEFLRSVMETAKAQRTLALVDELTDRFVKKNYPHWNRRKRKTQEAARLASTSAESQTVKYADIIDNTSIAGEDTDFAKVFLQECRSLLKVIDKGNPKLYQQAIAAVEEGLKLIENDR